MFNAVQDFLYKCCNCIKPGWQNSSNSDLSTNNATVCPQLKELAIFGCDQLLLTILLHRSSLEDENE